MSYNEDYYTEVDELFGKLRNDPFKGLLPDAPPQDGGAPMHPVGWVENAGSSDADATVKINSDGITVTGGSITVENPNGEVIIDGESRMFKVWESGTLEVTPTGTSETTAQVSHNGYPGGGTPIYLAYISIVNDFLSARRLNSWHDYTVSGSTIVIESLCEVEASYTSLNSQVTIRARARSSAAVPPTFYVKYYILRESLV